MNPGIESVNFGLKSREAVIYLDIESRKAGADLAVESREAGGSSRPSTRADPPRQPVPRINARVTMSTMASACRASKPASRGDFAAFSVSKPVMFMPS